MTETEIKYLLNDIALNNNRASFKRLYLFYYSKLFWFAKSFVKTDEAAEEIIDDVFLNLWLQRARLTDINNFSNYCYMSVKNKSLTQVSKAKLNQVSIDDMEAEVADSSATGEDKLICGDTAKIINNSLNKVSDQCKLVFKLVKEDGLKYREVAELLDLSVKTVEYHMGNALKQISLGILRSQKEHLAIAADGVIIHK
ncbi:RNA polymerase sigma-70 factor [Mucilaginibacter sp. FT3.2]|uniref:RNA polymerase sigma-70 factor n=1 Tax=Mucilaginibacter sp. FT3.2 TaxID=2723090 RepID=UPI0016077DBB|nr:RNA polymerase sigma-70 factor [Mucilaginibacter sp. FT3.2]MBB6231141.1 RNA polymerase sigma-70 factor (ECF subfamily) [Mucilaginibacter sp. FT3.2]